jgi:hypothetical protein
MSQRLFVSRISIKFTYHQEPQCVGEREREAAGRVNAMAAAFCVDCGLQLTGRYCGECGRDYGATDAAQRASCPLATAQQDVSSSTAGAQRAVAEAKEDVSSSTAGAQRAVAEAQQDVSSSTAGDHLPTVTSALALCAGCNARNRARGIYVGQEYHKLSRWTNGAFCETNAVA